MTGTALLHDAQHRATAHARVVLGHQAHQGTHHQAEDDGPEHVHAGDLRRNSVAHELHRLRKHPLDQWITAYGHQQHGTPVAVVQRVHHAIGILLDAHEQGAHDAEQDTETGDDHRQQDRSHASEVVGADHFAAQHHRCQHRSHVAAEEIGAHTGHITHVIAHVIGDGRRVACIILGDTGFHLSHEIRSHVGRFGVDATTHTGEQRDGFCTEAESCQDFQALHHLVTVGVAIGHVHAEEYDEERAETDHGQASNTEAHHGASVEAHLEALCQAGACRLGGTHVRFGSDAHADPTSEGAEEGPDQEGDGDDPVGMCCHGRELSAPSQQHGGDGGEYAQHLPFGFQEGTGATGDIASKLLHVGVASILFVHPHGLADHHHQTHHAHQGDVVHQFTSHRVFSCCVCSCPSARSVPVGRKRARK